MRTLTALLLTVAVLPACTSTKTESPPPPENTDPRLARITVDGKGVSLGADALGPVSAATAPLVKPLMDRLGERRRAWEGAHAGQTWEGKAEIEVGPNVSCKAALAVIETAIWASFSPSAIRSGATRLEVPGHGPLVQPAPPATRRAFLTFHADGSVDLRPTACLSPFDTVPAAALPAAVKEWYGTGGDSLGQTYVTCDDTTPADKVIAALAELRKGEKQMSIGSGPTCGEARAAGMGEAKLTLGMTDPLDDFYPGWELVASRVEPEAKGERPPVVRLENVMAGDQAASADVIAMIQAREQDLGRCYGWGFNRKPGLRGKIVAKLELGRKGGVTKVASGDKTDMPDPVVRCSLGVLSSIKLPPVAPGKAGVMTVPVLFSPGK